MKKNCHIYILTNYKNGTLYVGVTSNLCRRMIEHRNETFEGFTKRYSLKKLVYLELFDSILSAIAREKQLKGGSRLKKIELIERMNPKWIGLYDMYCR